MMKRRRFLRTVAAGVAVPCIIPRSVFASAGTPGANDRIAVGVIGCGGRVTALLHEAPTDLQVVALADCGLRQMTAASSFGKAVTSMARYTPAFENWKRYQDYREMFEQEKLDAVFVTTTTHAR